MMEECHYVYEYRGRSMDGWKRQIHRAASTRVPVSFFFSASSFFQSSIIARTLGVCHPLTLGTMAMIHPGPRAMGTKGHGTRTDP